MKSPGKADAARILKSFKPSQKNAPVDSGPRGSKYLFNEYLAQTILTISHIEIQSPHNAGAWTLRGCGAHLGSS